MRNAKYQRTKIPPRKDLELDALVEILQGERLVHCHSYRQDEIPNAHSSSRGFWL